jgi:RimJ/RimL family protein N-acetyltransferase
MSFELQPTLEGELLRLRPLRANDWENLFAVASDPLIWEQHPVADRYQAEVFRGFFREAMESGSAFVILNAKDGQVIGSSRFHGYDPGRSEIEIGWTFLARSYWGGVYNGELKRLMLRHAFQFVERVIFLVGPENFRSQRAMEKIGGVPIGSRRDENGRESLVFQIRRCDYLPRELARPSPEAQQKFPGK